MLRRKAESPALRRPDRGLRRLDRLVQRLLTRTVLVSRIIHIARDEHEHRQGDRAVAGEILAVFFEEVNGESDFVGELVGF